MRSTLRNLSTRRRHPLAGLMVLLVGLLVAGGLPVTNSGPQAPRKDPVYIAEETSQLAAYVASLGPGPSVPGDEILDYQSVDEEGVKRGGEFFRTNCTACHNSVGAGGALPSGRYAPKLTGVSAKHIYEAMVTGPQQMPVF